VGHNRHHSGRCFAQPARGVLYRMDPLLTVTGFAVGLLIGLTGMGGGSLMTPFLILVVGTRPVVAVGTDLAYGAITKIAGAWMHYRQGTVDLALVRRLAVGSVPAGIAAVGLVRVLPVTGIDPDEAVRQALGAVLVLVAVIMLARSIGVLSGDFPQRWRDALQGRATIAAGGIIGALVGFTSVGSGALLVPFLVCVFPQNSARIVGTDVFHAAILLTVTAAGHAHADAVDWPLAAALLGGSIPGVAVGSWMAPRMPARALRTGLASLLLVSGISLM
jgi:uncharacterized protein